jgi:hypothetical protein
MSDVRDQIVEVMASKIDIFLAALSRAGKCELEGRK